MDYNLLEKLCLAFGPSGYEREVRNIITDEIKDAATEYYTDTVGNVIAFKKGKKTPDKKLVFAAHMDEVGFMVTSSEKDGYARFRSIGVMGEVSLNKRVHIMPYVSESEIKDKTPEKIVAVIGAKPIHLLGWDESRRARSFDRMYFDWGVSAKEEKKNDKDKKEEDKKPEDKPKKDDEKLINVGDYAVFYGEYLEFGENDVKISAKALDDRFGCTILCDMIKSELEYDTWFAFTVCEEIGLRGAYAAGHQLKADAVIVVEATTANDVFDREKELQKVCRQGDGAVLSFADSGTVYDKAFIDLAVKIAEEKEIKVQFKEAAVGGTDAAAYQRSASGAKVLGISLPARYIHSANSVGDKRDMEACRDLAYALATAVHDNN